MAGTLFVVSTPIGNLEDITYRAVRILSEVELIACEDTRRTRQLLQRYNIQKPLLSYHEHNERVRVPELLERLQSGASVALVSDSGTPLISDPGYRLVAAAVEAGVPVVPIPGPSAVLAALAGAGLPCERFCFMGFLPAKPSERRQRLAELAASSITAVFYEAPHRILETLEDLAEMVPDRRVVIARELTKLHEEFLRGSPRELLEILRRRSSIKGEITVVVGKPPEKPPTASEEEIWMTYEVLRSEGLPEMEAIKQAARKLGLAKREVYRLVKAKADQKK